MIVLVDGNPVDMRSYERLLAFKAPAGAHSVEIRMESTSIYLLGRIVTGFSILGLVAAVLFLKWYQR